MYCVHQTKEIKFLSKWGWFLWPSSHLQSCSKHWRLPANDWGEGKDTAACSKSLKKKFNFASISMKYWEFHAPSCLCIYRFYKKNWKQSWKNISKYIYVCVETILIRLYSIPSNTYVHMFLDNRAIL